MRRSTFICTCPFPVYVACEEGDTASVSSWEKGVWDAYVESLAQFQLEPFLRITAASHNYSYLKLVAKMCVLKNKNLFFHPHRKTCMCSSLCILTQYSSWALLKFKNCLCMQVICVATQNKTMHFICQGHKIQGSANLVVSCLSCAVANILTEPDCLQEGSMCCIYKGRKTNKHCAFWDTSFAFAFVCKWFSLHVRHASQT